VSSNGREFGQGKRNCQSSAVENSLFLLSAILLFFFFVHLVLFGSCLLGVMCGFFSIIEGDESGLGKQGTACVLVLSVLIFYGGVALVVPI
jgi:hypothetical protein